MFNKYIKGKREIEATEKAYDLIYKSQGYKPVKEKNSNAESLDENNGIAENETDK